MLSELVWKLTINQTTEKLSAKQHLWSGTSCADDSSKASAQSFYHASKLLESCSYSELHVTKEEASQQVRVAIGISHVDLGLTSFFKGAHSLSRRGRDSFLCLRTAFHLGPWARCTQAPAPWRPVAEVTKGWGPHLWHHHWAMSTNELSTDHRDQGLVLFGSGSAAAWTCTPWINQPN